MVHFSSVHVRSELRAGGSPPGPRPAEDGAGRHAAGGTGSNITVTSRSHCEQLGGVVMGLKHY